MSCAVTARQCAYCVVVASYWLRLLSRRFYAFCDPWVNFLLARGIIHRPSRSGVVVPSQLVKCAYCVMVALYWLKLLSRRFYACFSWVLRSCMLCRASVPLALPRHRKRANHIFNLSSRKNTVPLNAGVQTPAKIAMVLAVPLADSFHTYLLVDRNEEAYLLF